MIEYGFESPAWLARAAIAQSNPEYVRVAAMEVIQWLVSGSESFSAFEVIDRLVQVSVTGKYTPPEDVDGIVREAMKMADQMFSTSSESTPLTPEQEDILKKFSEAIDETPDAEDPMDGFKL